MLDSLERAIHSPNGSTDSTRWLKPAIKSGGIGVSALLVLAVGAAEVTWLFQGSGLALVTRAAHHILGVG